MLATELWKYPSSNDKHLPQHNIKQRKKSQKIKKIKQKMAMI